MTELQGIKLTRMVLIRSGKFDFADFDIESPIHLSGGNRNGKTTLINAIQLAISYDLKECSWDGHDIEATKNTISVKEHIFCLNLIHQLEHIA